MVVFSKPTRNFRALIRRRPKNEKKCIKTGLETVCRCFKTRYFYADSCFLILKFRFSLGEILPRRTNVRLPVRYSPTLHPPERPKGTFLWALIRRRPKNEKELKQGLEAALSCFKTRCFYMSDCFFILMFRFTLGEIVLVLYEKYI